MEEKKLEEVEEKKDEFSSEQKEEKDPMNSIEPKKAGKKKKNRKKVLIIVIVLLILVILAAVYFVFSKDKDENKTDSTKTKVKEVHSEYRMSGNNLQDFDLRFLQLETNNQNIVYSPLSIKYTLAMLKEGAKGSSKAQLDALIGDYKANKYVNSSNMSFANALFIKNTFQKSVKEKYVNNLLQKYNAEIIYDEFNNPDNVNSWISNKTFNLINDLVDDVSETKVMLVNALAIDMEWNKWIQATTETDRERYFVHYDHENYSEYIRLIEDDNYGTVKFNNKTMNSKAVEIGASINNYDIVKDLGEENIRNTIRSEYQEWLKKGESCGSELDVDTYVDKFIQELKKNYQRVDASTDFRVYVDDHVKVFAKELKEYNGTTLEYVGIMPKDKTLNEFVKSSNSSSINSLIDKLKTISSDNFESGKVIKIKGGIPLFSYNYELDLMKDLQNLGVTDVFDLEKADLSNLTSEKNIFINDAAHKANIEFSNEGIKAAAATPMNGSGASSCGFDHLYDVPVVEIDLTFDNPYLYIIRDKSSGEVWFVGTVYQPTENTLSNAKVINE